MIRKSVAEILDQHVTFELEAIDRMYLNAYVPSLQTGGGVVYFLKTQLGVRVPDAPAQPQTSAYRCSRVSMMASINWLSGTPCIWRRIPISV